METWVANKTTMVTKYWISVNVNFKEVNTLTSNILLCEDNG